MLCPPTKPFSSRGIHLVDIENLLGNARFDLYQVIDLENRYRELATVSDGDLVVIASGHPAAKAAWFGWSPTRRLLRSGPSGADLALVDVIEREGLAGRFGRVVIGSGDGVFAEPAAKLQAAGCDVSVIAQRPGSVSRRLAFAVREIAYVEPGDGSAEIGLAA